MVRKQKASKTINVFLWIAQALLSACLIWAAGMKLFQPVDKLAAMWPWTAEHPVLVKVTGVIDLFAGIGLVLPGLLRIQPRLTIYAASGVIALMVAAGIFHIARGEASQIGFNVFVAVVAGFVVLGRRRAGR
jgi:hypothetical protein